MKPDKVRPSQSERRTLLAVSPVSPWPAADGMSLRVSKLLEELANHWSIVLAAPEGGNASAPRGVALAAEVSLPRTGKWMYLPSQYDTRPVVDVVARAIREHQPAAAVLWSGMEYLSRDIPNMPPNISDRVDCMTLTAWRDLRHSDGVANALRHLSQLLYVARYEFTLRSASEATVVVGESDAAVLRRMKVRNTRVVPNGVDISGTFGSRATRPTVVFTGVLSFQPNYDAVVYFVRDIWPSVRARVPDAVLQIVGRTPGSEIQALSSQSGVEVHADVKSVQSFLSRAWVAVAPMRTGAGLKNKILEAWSVGTPVVMTPIATNGLLGAPTELMLKAEGSRFADLVVQVLTDPTRREELSSLARTTAQEQFSWTTQARLFNALLEGAAALE
jgi:glycosyltransferase involved in cell wall biosynthesis